jgi:hypothetical protein
VSYGAYLEASSSRMGYFYGLVRESGVLVEELLEFRFMRSSERDQLLVMVDECVRLCLSNCSATREDVERLRLVDEDDQEVWGIRTCMRRSAAAAIPFGSDVIDYPGEWES